MKSLRKIISFSLVLIMVFSTFINVDANSNIQLVVDGKSVVFTDAYPFVENGRTLVPVRALAEAMDATVDWNGKTNTVTLTKGSFSLSLKIGQHKTDFGNGNTTITKSMDTKAIVINGRTYIPARFVGYGLGYSVEWKDPVVYYTFINKQTTDFEIDPNVKYPKKHNLWNLTFSYYDGYGDVKIVNGDEGDIVEVYGDYSDEPILQYQGNAFRYQYTPIWMIFESKNLNVDINKKTPEENLNNFKEVFEDITLETVVKDEPDNAIVLYLTYNTSKNVTNVSYDKNRQIFGLDKYNREWAICNTDAQTNFSNYLFLSDEGAYIPGSVNQNIRNNGAEKNTLMLLNTFLGEDGQKIWQMLFEYYNNIGKQYVAPNTYWPYSENAENPKPPITKEIVEMYDLEFVEYESDEYGLQYTTVFSPHINRPVTIKYGPIRPAHGTVNYSILF